MIRTLIAGIILALPVAPNGSMVGVWLVCSWMSWAGQLIQGGV